LEVDAVNRAPRAAALGVLLLSPLALGACSAGQVAQTATQEQNLGNQADVGDLHLRAVELPYPIGGVYPAGGSARLLAAVASDSAEDDTLVSIEGEDFESVEVVDPTATASASPAAGASGSAVDLTVPAGGTLFIGNGDGPSVTLVGFADEVGVGQYVDVTFTFEEAGEVTMQVPVAVAARDLPRGERFDYHEEADDEQTGGGPG
jgi:copper(I)-binding protein